MYNHVDQYYNCSLSCMACGIMTQQKQCMWVTSRGIIVSNSRFKLEGGGVYEGFHWLVASSLSSLNRIWLWVNLISQFTWKFTRTLTTGVTLGLAVTMSQSMAHARNVIRKYSSVWEDMGLLCWPSMTEHSVHRTATLPCLRPAWNRCQEIYTSSHRVPGQMM